MSFNVLGSPRRNAKRWLRVKGQKLSASTTFGRSKSAKSEKLPGFPVSPSGRTNAPLQKDIRDSMGRAKLVGPEGRNA
jgi:hypothetical protein